LENQEAIEAIETTGAIGAIDQIKDKISQVLGQVERRSKVERARMEGEDGKDPRIKSKIKSRRKYQIRDIKIIKIEGGKGKKKTLSSDCYYRVSYRAYLIPLHAYLLGIGMPCHLYHSPATRDLRHKSTEFCCTPLVIS
jgi:hypothetical protein